LIIESIKKLIEGLDLESNEAKQVMKEIMSGEASESQVGAFLTAIRMKGETIQELSSFASVMRDFCHQIRPHVNGRLLDVVGTGGDKVKTFNISTISAFVAAGSGVNVAKHGNRSFTSKCGSADVLDKLGYNLEVEPKMVEALIEKVGIGFLYAPRFHPAMKHAIKPRREIGVRTVFNLLGPITNPAFADALVLGVYSPSWVQPLAHVLNELGIKEAMVVHGIHGLDEISIIGPTKVSWLKNGEITPLEINPREYGMKIAEPEQIQGTTPQESAKLTFRLLSDDLEPGDPRMEAVKLNAAAGILVGGRASEFKHGIELASESIESGVAYNKMKMMVKGSGGDLSILEELEKGA
jgi:anthranilate phosphoribosyltransferase